MKSGRARAIIVASEGPELSLNGLARLASEYSSEGYRVFIASGPSGNFALWRWL